MSSVVERVGGRVRRLRQQRGWTVRHAAATAGLSQRFYAQLEAGQANISIGRLEAVAGSFGVGLPELLAHDGSAAGELRRRIDTLLAGRSDLELAGCVRALELALGDASHDSAVALLGLRGAGKSTLGPSLAATLGLPFVELDERIEHSAGMSLPELFALHGEPYYRRLEGQCLATLLAEPSACVVALPGGVVHNEEAFGLARRACTTVWLRARPDDHMGRVLAQGDRRPVADRPDAMAELRALLANREPLYRQADLTIDTSGYQEEEALNRLLVLLERRGWRGRSTS